MNRRAILATAAAVAVSVAGCVDGGDPDTDDPGAGSDGGSDGSDEETDENDGEGSDIEIAANPAVDRVEIDELDPSETGSAGEATIEFAAEAVRVEGTVVGTTGCHSVTVAEATVSGDEFRLVVAAVDDAEPDEMCTQALTEVGYEVDAAFDGGLPASVTVVHDDADGQATVASDAPDDADGSGE
ncbi:MAG: hypothetical protein PPP55_11545 [Halorubrum sp.]